MKLPKILIADDDSINRELLKEILSTNYKLIESCNGTETINMIKQNEKDLSLVLLDMVMPDKDGIQVIKEIKKHSPSFDIPIIFVTAMDTFETETNSIKAGAVDYIKKPFNADVIRARIAAHISLKKNTDYLRREIEAAVLERTKIIQSVVLGLANIIEYRSIESGTHVKRVQEITKMIIDKLLETTLMLEDYSPTQLSYIVYASALHDIGKVGIPDEILLKPGRFSDVEYELMKKHSEIGAKIAEHFYMGEDKDFTKFCKEICYCHHEKWDGSGYPNGLKAYQIPLSARIVAVADAFDAIVSPRVYKKPITQEQAFEILQKDSETHFDPHLVDIMLTLKEELHTLYELYAENNSTEDISIEKRR